METVWRFRALLFGFVDALQIKLQIVGVHVPYQFLSMAPYVVTMIVLAGLIGARYHLQL